MTNAEQHYDGDSTTVSMNSTDTAVDPGWIHGETTPDAVTTSRTAESTVVVGTNLKKIFLAVGDDGGRNRLKNFFFGVEDATTVSTPLTRNQNRMKAAGRPNHRDDCTVFSKSKNYYYYYYCIQVGYNTNNEYPKDTRLYPGWIHGLDKEVGA